MKFQCSAKSNSGQREGDGTENVTTICDMSRIFDNFTTNDADLRQFTTMYDIFCPVPFLPFLPKFRADFRSLV